VRVPLILGSNVEIDLAGEVCLPFAAECTIRIVKEHTSPREDANSVKRVTAHLEAFPSASAAERAGTIFAASILWVAASNRVSIAFEGRTGDFPFSIRDRNRSEGVSARGELRGYYTMTPSEPASIAEAAYRHVKDVPPHVLTSLEFFASARMESTERARFIALIIALEALSVQRDYAEALPKLPALLDKLATRVEGAALLRGEQYDSIRASLSSRLKQLRFESVRQAIVRTVKVHIKDKPTIKFVDEAYGVRSKILHEGLREPELHEMTHRLEGIMRDIYSSLLGLPLVR
jgi:hypothetical protein